MIKAASTSNLTKPKVYFLFGFFELNSNAIKLNPNAITSENMWKESPRSANELERSPPMYSNNAKLVVKINVI